MTKVQDSTESRRATEEASATIGVPMTRFPMGTLNCSMPLEFPARPTSVGGRQNRVLIPYCNGSILASADHWIALMNRRTIGQLGFVIAMSGIAALFTWRYFQQGTGVSEKEFYYDLSQKKLFVSDRGQVPPIRGVNDTIEDGVRAVVISTAADPNDKKYWKVAYLEKYTPQLKAQMEFAKASGQSPEMGRAAAQAHRLVKRMEDSDWVSLATPEGERIVSEWTAAGADGIAPVVCTP